MVAGTVILALIILGSTEFIDFTLIYIAIWFTGAGIASWNDSLDHVEDAIAHPERPIPSGAISIQKAKAMGSILIVFGFLAGLIISFSAFLLILVSTIIGILYSLTTKKILLLKNFTVIFSGILVLISLPEIYNLSATNDYYFYFIPSISLLLFSYEVLKDIHDIEGDSKVGIKTIVSVINPVRSAIFAVSLFVFSCLLMAYSFYSNEYYLESAISGITALVIIIPGYKIRKNPSPEISEVLRYAIVSIVLVSLSIVGFLLLNRNISNS